MPLVISAFELNRDKMTRTLRRAHERHPAWSGSNIWHPTTGADLVAQARAKNRTLAISVAGLVVLMFGMTIFAGVLDHLNAKAPGGLFARSAAVERPSADCGAANGAPATRLTVFKVRVCAKAACAKKSR